MRTGHHDLIQRKKEVMMKKSILMLSSCAMLLSVTSVSYSAEGPYLSFTQGFSMLNDFDVVASEEMGIRTIGYKPDPGLSIGAAIGYNYSNFRVEGEFSCQRHYIYEGSMDSVSQGELDTTMSAEMISYAGLLNVYYDLHVWNAFTPFLSVGIGMADVYMNDVKTYTIGGEPNPWYMVENFNGTSLVYQIGGGVSYAFCDNIAFDFKYRYYSTTDLTMDGGALGPRDNDYSSHNIYYGIRVTF